ncbi:MAG: GNAT family N-acetyltransferase [Sporolactobacillus sp.]
MQFRTIDPEKDRETILKFRRDSFQISFGTDEDFDEQKYMGWIRAKVKDFPDGLVLAILNDHIIGQLELTIRVDSGKRLGYINLIYLIPELRGFGLGELLHQYAMRFFREHDLQNYQLRVSTTNQQAIAFYEKSGMKQMKMEIDGKVIRMRGEVLTETKKG